MKKNTVLYGLSLVLILVGVTAIFSPFVPVDQIADSAKRADEPRKVAGEVISPNFNLRFIEEQISGKRTEDNLTLVTKVIDGDTIEIEGGDRVRYIGIDTPETFDPRKKVQCFGRQASNKNKDLVGGKKVRLENDVNDTDKYGRLLRYVWVDETLINETLVKEGFAFSSPYPPDVKYQARLDEAQTFAQSKNLGL